MPKFEDHKTHIMQMVHAAVAAVDPFACTANGIQREGGSITLAERSFDISAGKIIIIAIGKAAIPMLNGANSILGDRISYGVAVTKKGQGGQVNHSRVTVHFAAHPVPDESSVQAAEAVLDCLSQATDSDLVIFLISGGASALCTKPLIPLAEWQTLSKALLASGCTIQEFNTVRKQLDEVKGGGLAQRVIPAKFVTLVLSDVIGNPIDMIGSGPTVPNPQKPEDAVAILNKYRIEHRLAIDALSNLPFHAGWFESPVEIVGDLAVAAKASQTVAMQLGFKASIRSTELVGEASDVGKMAAELSRKLLPGDCVIFGGETTVTIQGNGVGGRNQELALSAAIGIRSLPNIVIATYATDGDDGPTAAAGAIVTGETIELGGKKGIDAAEYLANNDSHSYFSRLGDQLIVTGQTGTNVNDLLFVIRY